MKNVKRAMNHLCILYSLAAFMILFTGEIIPFVFPMYHLSTIIYLFLSVFLILYYKQIVVSRKGIRAMMNGIAFMILFLLFLRGIKYSVFMEIDILARYTWYMYYVPMLMISTFLFYVSILIFEKEDKYIPVKWLWVLGIVIVLILMVLTNDMHQWVFRFQSGFQNWDSDYRYGWGFIPVVIWQYCFAIAVIIWLTIKCRISDNVKHAWLFFIPVLLGTFMILLLVTGKMPTYHGNNLIELPEVYCIMAVGVLECCIQLGLIPSNEEYSKILKISSLAVQISDKNGNAIYRADTVPTLSKDWLDLQDGSRLENHTILRKMVVPGGYGIWLEDVKELDDLNDKLSETNNQLEEEFELIRFQNELREKEASILQRSELYDTIAKSCQKQSKKISQIAQEAKITTDSNIKERARREITLLATYIKRYANLMLLSEDGKEIQVAELFLSITEVLRRLNLCKIPGEIFNCATGSIHSSYALCIFEVFEGLLEINLDTLHGILINLSNKDDSIVCKMNLEGEKINTSVLDILMKYNLQTNMEQEDGIIYISITIPRGGSDL